MATRQGDGRQRLLTAVAAAAALAIAPPAPASGSRIERVPVTQFEWPETVEPGPARFVVRPATVDELAAVREKLAEDNVFLAAALGISAVAAEAAALGGMFAGGLAAGAILMVPLSLGIYVHDRVVAGHMREGLDLGAFLDEIRAGLPSDPQATATTLKVEVRILDFGLVERDPPAAGSNHLVCLVADAEIAVKHSGESLYDEILYVRPYLRSADAPAPFCRVYAAWGQREAALLVAARRDLARSLAGMVLGRLQPIVGSD